MRHDRDSRRMSGWLRCLVITVAVLGGSASVEAVAATISVEDFLAAKERWDKLLGRPITVEGRVSTMNGTTIILQKCSTLIEFRSERELPDATGSDVAEVSGELVRDEKLNRVFFSVSKVRLLPDDLARVQSLRRDLPKDDPQAWYALGEWAVNRAKFYGKTDDPLYAESKRLFELGLSRERRLMEGRTPQKLRDLAVKARSLGIDDSIRMSMIHESYFMDWQEIRLKGESGELLGLATTLSAALPGAGDPLATAPDVENTRARYFVDPLKFYDEAADESLRKKLHRMLYQKVVDDAIGKETDPAGRNGKVVAKIITDYLPERIDEVKIHIAAERTWRLKNVQTFRRPEMLALRQEFLELGDRESAAVAIDRWFERKESELRREGIDGLLDLATEYEIRFDLLDDVDDLAEKKAVHEKIVALLMDAYRKNPELGTTQRRLEAYGYRLRDGSWKTPAEVEQFLNTPRQRAMAEGRVVSGMTGVEVVKSLGKPDRVTRVLTARNVVELWAYGAPGETPLVVRLVRTGNRSRSIVTDWKQLGTAAGPRPAASNAESEAASSGNP